MIGVNIVDGGGIERVVYRLVTGYLFADSQIEGVADELVKHGVEVAQDITWEMVYMQPSTYEDRRTMDLFNAITGSRFQSGTAAGQVYISRQKLEKYYPPYVEFGTIYFEGRHFWEATRAALRSQTFVGAERASRNMAIAMTR